MEEEVKRRVVEIRGEDEEMDEKEEKEEKKK